MKALFTWSSSYEGKIGDGICAVFFFFFNWKNGVLGTRIGNGSGKYHGLENGIYTYIYLKALIRHMLFSTFHFLFRYFFGSFEHHTRLAKRNFELSKFGVEARESAHRNNPCASILAVFILSMKKLKSASSHAQMPVNENTGHSLFERRLTKKTDTMFGMGYSL